MTEQLELELEWPVYDHYTIELRKGNPPDDLTIERSMDAKSIEGAIGIIEGFRDHAESREGVTWRDREVDGTGNLYGLAKGVVWQIHVTPDLNTELAE